MFLTPDTGKCVLVENDDAVLKRSSTGDNVPARKKITFHKRSSSSSSSKRNKTSAVPDDIFTITGLEPAEKDNDKQNQKALPESSSSNSSSSTKIKIKENFNSASKQLVDDSDAHVEKRRTSVVSLGANDNLDLDENDSDTDKLITLSAKKRKSGAVKIKNRMKSLPKSGCGECRDETLNSQGSGKELENADPSSENMPLSTVMKNNLEELLQYLQDGSCGAKAHQKLPQDMDKEPEDIIKVGINGIHSKENSSEEGAQTEDKIKNLNKITPQKSLESTKTASPSKPISFEVDVDNIEKRDKRKFVRRNLSSEQKTEDRKCKNSNDNSCVGMFCSSLCDSIVDSQEVFSVKPVSRTYSKDMVKAFKVENRRKQHGGDNLKLIQHSNKNDSLTSRTMVSAENADTQTLKYFTENGENENLMAPEVNINILASKTLLSKPRQVQFEVENLDKASRSTVDTDACANVCTHLDETEMAAIKLPPEQGQTQPRSRNRIFKNKKESLSIVAAVNVEQQPTALSNSGRLIDKSDGNSVITFNSSRDPFSFNGETPEKKLIKSKKGRSGRGKKIRGKTKITQPLEFQIGGSKKHSWQAMENTDHDEVKGKDCNDDGSDCDCDDVDQQESKNKDVRNKQNKSKNTKERRAHFKNTSVNDSSVLAVEALDKMRTKISEAENFDLIHSTQEARQFIKEHHQDKGVNVDEKIEDDVKEIENEKEEIGDEEELFDENSGRFRAVALNIKKKVEVTLGNEFENSPYFSAGNKIKFDPTPTDLAHELTSYENAQLLSNDDDNVDEVIGKFVNGKSSTKIESTIKAPEENKPLCLSINAPNKQVSLPEEFNKVVKTIQAASNGACTVNNIEDDDDINNGISISDPQGDDFQDKNSDTEAKILTIMRKVKKRSDIAMPNLSAMKQINPFTLNLTSTSSPLTLSPQIMKTGVVCETPLMNSKSSLYKNMNEKQQSNVRSIDNADGDNGLIEEQLSSKNQKRKDNNGFAKSVNSKLNTPVTGTDSLLLQLDNAGVTLINVQDVEKMDSQNIDSSVITPSLKDYSSKLKSSKYSSNRKLFGVNKTGSQSPKSVCRHNIGSVDSPSINKTDDIVRLMKSKTKDRLPRIERNVFNIQPSDNNKEVRCSGRKRKLQVDGYVHEDGNDGDDDDDHHFQETGSSCVIPPTETIDLTGEKELPFDAVEHLTLAFTSKTIPKSQNLSNSCKLDGNQVHLKNSNVSNKKVKTNERCSVGDDDSQKTEAGVLSPSIDQNSFTAIWKKGSKKKTKSIKGKTDSLQLSSSKSPSSLASSVLSDSCDTAKKSTGDSQKQDSPFRKSLSAILSLKLTDQDVFNTKEENEKDLEDEHTSENKKRHKNKTVNDILPRHTKDIIIAPDTCLDDEDNRVLTDDDDNTARPIVPKFLTSIPETVLPISDDIEKNSYSQDQDDEEEPSQESCMEEEKIDECKENDLTIIDMDADKNDGVKSLNVNNLFDSNSNNNSVDADSQPICSTYVVTKGLKNDTDFEVNSIPRVDESSQESQKSYLISADEECDANTNKQSLGLGPQESYSATLIYNSHQSLFSDGKRSLKNQSTTSNATPDSFPVSTTLSSVIPLQGSYPNGCKVSLQEEKTRTSSMSQELENKEEKAILSSSQSILEELKKQGNYVSDSSSGTPGRNLAVPFNASAFLEKTRTKTNYNYLDTFQETDSHNVALNDVTNSHVDLSQDELEDGQDVSVSDFEDADCVLMVRSNEKEGNSALKDSRPVVPVIFENEATKVQVQVQDKQPCISSDEIVSDGDESTIDNSTDTTLHKTTSNALELFNKDFQLKKNGEKVDNGQASTETDLNQPIMVSKKVNSNVSSGGFEVQMGPGEVETVSESLEDESESILHVPQTRGNAKYHREEKDAISSTDRTLQCDVSKKSLEDDHGNGEFKKSRIQDHNSVPVPTENIAIYSNSASSQHRQNYEGTVKGSTQINQGTLIAGQHVTPQTEETEKTLISGKSLEGKDKSLPRGHEQSSEKKQQEGLKKKTRRGLAKRGTVFNLNSTSDTPGKSRLSATEKAVLDLEFSGQLKNRLQDSCSEEAITKLCDNDEDGNHQGKLVKKTQTGTLSECQKEELYHHSKIENNAACVNNNDSNNFVTEDKSRKHKVPKIAENILLQKLSEKTAQHNSDFLSGRTRSTKSAVISNQNNDDKSNEIDEEGEQEKISRKKYLGEKSSLEMSYEDNRNVGKVDGENDDDDNDKISSQKADENEMNSSPSLPDMNLTFDFGNIGDDNDDNKAFNKCIPFENLGSSFEYNDDSLSDHVKTKEKKSKPFLKRRLIASKNSSPDRSSSEDREEVVRIDLVANPKPQQKSQPKSSGKPKLSTREHGKPDHSKSYISNADVDFKCDEGVNDNVIALDVDEDDDEMNNTLDKSVRMIETVEESDFMESPLPSQPVSTSSPVEVKNNLQERVNEE